MFGDLGQPDAGRYLPVGRRLAELAEQIRLADEAGLDVFGIGEHHRPDYAVSAPQIVLAYAAAHTRTIKLGSAVTVLSSDDPVRVYQQFATLDQLTEGRAELIVGRGSFIESFPLFGYRLEDYDRLFTEKLDLLLAVNGANPLSWAGGEFTPAVRDQLVLPRPFNGSLPLWLAVGGTPQSVERAARLGIPLMLAIIGGNPRSFSPLVQYYREAYDRYEHAPEQKKVGVHAHTFIGENARDTADRYYRLYAAQMDKIGKERGWPPYSKMQYEAGRGEQGALLIGDAAAVTDKILQMQELFGLDRFMAHMDTGAPDHKEVMKAIEIFGSRVAPEVRKALAG